ncbi:hypothetical protein LWP59_23185 [Amycolatopsis acidiphila]|nr:hypothetical protein [Amycolatopsis acidiphila]UIJ57060.1 hypothetical protein LWP59_23185 [Amycolatopsis acidiphila]
MRNTTDRSSGDWATTATGQATSRPSFATRWASSSTTARSPSVVAAAVSIRACRPASHARFRRTNFSSCLWPRTSPARGSCTTTSPGHAASSARAFPLSSAAKYCPTGSARPAARVCLRTSSTALAKSGNHGISTHAPRVAGQFVPACRLRPRSDTLTGHGPL